MPKAKTRKSAAKRMGLTGTGKVTMRHSFVSHQLTRKGTARKRRQRLPGLMSGSDVRQARRMLPGSG